MSMENICPASASTLVNIICCASRSPVEYKCMDCIRVNDGRIMTSICKVVIPRIYTNGYNSDTKPLSVCSIPAGNLTSIKLNSCTGF